MLTLHSVRVSFGSFSTGHRHNEASSVRRFETVAAAFLSRRALEHSAHSGHSPHTWPFLLTKHGLPRNKDIRLTSSFFYPVNWTLFHLSQSPLRVLFETFRFLCVQLHDSIIHVRRHLAADGWIKKFPQKFASSGSIVSIFKRIEMKSVNNSNEFGSDDAGAIRRRPPAPDCSRCFRDGNALISLYHLNQ